jgi:hypothetical protein
MISLAEETIICSHALGRPGRVACAFDPPCDASAAGPILLARLCGWPLQRAPARRFIKHGHILLLFTDEVSLIWFEAEAARLFLSVFPRRYQRPSASRQKTFGNDVAAARMDRLAYHVQVISPGPRREPHYGGAGHSGIFCWLQAHPGIRCDPEARLRDIAATLGITGRSIFGSVNGLTAARCVAKGKDGRRDRPKVRVSLRGVSPRCLPPTPARLERKQRVSGNELCYLASARLVRKRACRAGPDRRRGCRLPGPGACVPSSRCLVRSRRAG